MLYLYFCGFNNSGLLPTCCYCHVALADAFGITRENVVCEEWWIEWALRAIAAVAEVWAGQCLSLSLIHMHMLHVWMHVCQTAPTGCCILCACYRHMSLLVMPACMAGSPFLEPGQYLACHYLHEGKRFVTFRLPRLCCHVLLLQRSWRAFEACSYATLQLKLVNTTQLQL